MDRSWRNLRSIFLIVAIAAVVLNSFRDLYEHRDYYHTWQSLRQNQRELAAWPNSKRAAPNAHVGRIELEACWRSYQPSWGDLASHLVSVLLTLEATRGVVLLIVRGALVKIGANKSPTVDFPPTEGQ